MPQCLAPVDDGDRCGKIRWRSFPFIFNSFSNFLLSALVGQRRPPTSFPFEDILLFSGPTFRRPVSLANVVPDLMASSEELNLDFKRPDDTSDASPIFGTVMVLWFLASRIGAGYFAVTRYIGG